MVWSDQREGPETHRLEVRSKEFTLRENRYFCCLKPHGIVPTSRRESWTLFSENQSSVPYRGPLSASVRSNHWISNEGDRFEAASKDFVCWYFQPLFEKCGIDRAKIDVEFEISIGQVGQAGV